MDFLLQAWVKKTIYGVEKTLSGKEIVLGALVSKRKLCQLSSGT